MGTSIDATSDSVPAPEPVESSASLQSRVPDASTVARSAHNLDLLRTMRAAGHGNDLAPDQLDAWVNEDVRAYRALGDDVAASLNTLLAANSSVYPPYMEALRTADPRLATMIEAESELMSVARFIGENVNALPEKIAERLENLAPGIRAAFGDAGKMNALDALIDAQLHWIPSLQIKDVHAAIASALGRRDAVARQEVAREARAAFERETKALAAADPARLQRQAQEVADFIASNKGLLEWKVNENIANADDELKEVMADASRMKELDPHVNARLAGINPVFIHDMQSLIANRMRRADADQRAQSALRLHTELDPRPSQMAAGNVLAQERLPTSAEHGARQDPALPQARENPGEHAPEPDAPLARRSDAAHQAFQARHQSNDANPAANPSPVRPNAMPAANSERNGFAPSEPSPAPPVAMMGNLLERMNYKLQKDGSVLYLIDDRPAFVDHGDQLLMAGASDQDEHAILAALVMAKEKYGGSFEVTGDAEFKRRAISVMLKYKVDVRLKSPAQDAMLRELSRSLEEGIYRPATPSAPVVPFDLGTDISHDRNAARYEKAARAMTPAGVPSGERLPDSATQPELHEPVAPLAGKSRSHGVAPVAQERSIAAVAMNAAATQPSSFPESAEPVNRLAGKILNFGHAPFDHVPGNSASYFVELENADGRTRTTWGIDLARAVKKAAVGNGDEVILQNLGKKAVDVPQQVVDADGQAHTTTMKTHKFIWDIEVIASAGMAEAERPHVQDAPKQRAPLGVQLDRQRRSPNAPTKNAQRREIPAPTSVTPAVAAAVAKPKARRPRTARLSG